MMSMIVGEGTNLDGKGVTMIGLEKEMRDVEMTGMIGSGTEEEGNAGAEESTEIMTEVGERDSLHRGMT